MANQPAADGAAVYLRLPAATKQAIQTEVDRLNSERPGAGYTLSSWIRAAIDAELAKSKKAAKKINKQAI